MVGMDDVAETVRRRMVSLYVDKVREEETGASAPPRTHHMVIEGRPGTGKSTLGEILAQSLNAAGITRRPTYTAVAASELTGQGYEGEAAAATKALLAENEGGVVFIDEAHQLANPRSTFAAEVRSVLVPAMTDALKTGTVIVLAGYPGTLDDLSARDSGFASRVPATGRYRLHDYTDDQLTEMAARRVQGTFDAKALTALRSAIKRLPTETDDYANGRGVEQLTNAIHEAHNLRVASMPPGEEKLDAVQRYVYTADDVRAGFAAMGVPKRRRKVAA